MILKFLNEIDYALQADNYSEFSFRSGMVIGLCSKYKLDLSVFHELSIAIYDESSGLKSVKNLLRTVRKELLNGNLAIGEKHETT